MIRSSNQPCNSATLGSRSGITGASGPEQLADMLAAVDVTLDGDLKARLNELISQYRRDDAMTRCVGAVRLDGTGTVLCFASAGRALAIASSLDIKVRYAVC